MNDLKLGNYLTLEDFCTCTQTYHKYASYINPFPKNTSEVIPALQDLNKFILDPIIDNFGKDKFCLTYGFCAADLKKYLEKKDSITGKKNGRIAPKIDQHFSYEVNNNGQYYCERLGAACDFMINGISSEEVVGWILKSELPFDSLYFYGNNRPIHVSYGYQHKRDIWTFNDGGVPTRKGIENWVSLAKKLRLNNV